MRANRLQQEMFVRSRSREVMTQLRDLVTSPFCSYLRFFASLQLPNYSKVDLLLAIRLRRQAFSVAIFVSRFALKSVRLLFDF